jgi:hypothetical protein
MFRLTNLTFILVRLLRDHLVSRVDIFSAAWAPNWSFRRELYGGMWNARCPESDKCRVGLTNSMERCSC